MYNSSAEESVLVLIGSSRYSRICIYAKGWMNLDSLRFDKRYSARGIAKMSSVVLYIITR